VRILILAFTVVASVVTSPALGAGYYNLPTSLPQCLGMGFGPGYHAPMLMGPMMKAPTSAQRVERLPAALTPPMCGGYDAATVWSDAPPVEHWQGPLHGHIRSLPAVGSSALMQAAGTVHAIAPSTHGTGFVGGVEVLAAPSPMGR
jgi:hypothetical protein